MSYRDVINTILPSRESKVAHITGHYGESRTSGRHGGSDFNYVGGQAGINLEHPTVHSPVGGTVVFVGGQYGTIKIRDEFGNTHEILHTDAQLVEVDQVVALGTAIGTMGGRGPRGAEQYAQHVHYQLKDENGRLLNPEAYWNQRPLLSHADNPHNFLYRQTLDRVHLMEVERCIIPGPHSENLAAALTHAAVRDRLARVDRVELNDAGTLARAVQVNPLRDEPGLNRATLPVGTQGASRQPLDWTSEQVRQLDEAIRVQQQEQPRLRPREERDIDAATGLQPFSHPDHPQHALYADVRQRFGAKGIELSEAQLSGLTRQMHGAGYEPGWQGDVTVYNDKAVVGSFQIGSRMASVDLSTPVPSVQDTMKAFQTDQQDRAQAMESLHQQQSLAKEHGHRVG